MALGPEGDLIWVRDGDAISQHLLFRLRFFLGEWFLDIREGIPYFEKILVKLQSLTTPRSILRRVIQDTPGITVITRLVLNLNSASRELSVSFDAQTDKGTRISSEFDVPFIPDQEIN